MAMSMYPLMEVTKKAPSHCGEFMYSPRMPWGPWYLTCLPKALFATPEITVLECFADELVQDESGVATECTSESNPYFRHFLVAKNADGKIIWWHNLGRKRFDTQKNKPIETAIYRDGDNVVVQGFGCELEPTNRLAINIKTGTKTKLLHP